MYILYVCRKSNSEFLHSMLHSVLYRRMPHAHRGPGALPALPKPGAPLAADVQRDVPHTNAVFPAIQRPAHTPFRDQYYPMEYQDSAFQATEIFSY